MFYGNNIRQIIVENFSIQLSNINSPWLYTPKTERSNSGRKVLQFKSVFKRKQNGLNKKKFKTSPVQIQCFPLKSNQTKPRLNTVISLVLVRGIAVDQILQLGEWKTISS